MNSKEKQQQKLRERFRELQCQKKIIEAEQLEICAEVLELCDQQSEDSDGN